jgi:hypothetical protein
MRRLHTAERRRSVRIAGFAVLVLWLVAACGGIAARPSATPTAPASSGFTRGTAPPARPSLAVPSRAPASVGPAISLAPLAAELVGTWRTSTWLNADGSQADWRIYRFTPDGLYDYTLAHCTPDCVVQGYEWGYAQTADGFLALTPQTDPSDGRRGWPYAVGRDPNVGDVQLHFTLPDGQTDIFYFG